MKERRRTPAVARSLLALLSLVAGSAARARGPFAVAGPKIPAGPAGSAETPGDEIIEAWPDGSPHRRYKLDPDGKLQGDYQEWWENGRAAVRTWYEHGAIDGSYASFHDNGAKHVVTRYAHGKLSGSFVETGADGKPLVEANYADGALDGKRTIWRDGAPASRQVWKRGELVDLMGCAPYPQTLEKIRTELATIRAQTPTSVAPRSAEPEPKAGTKPAPKPAPKSGKEKGKGAKGEAHGPPTLPVPAGYAPADDTQYARRFAALKRLQEYRLLADVAWRDVELAPAYDYYCDCAGRLLERVGHLEHTPPNPGMPDDEYRDGYAGTSQSNLFSASDPAITAELERSVDCYMEDSDPSNIGRVGHRRHCIHPQLQLTGFGNAEHYSAMWSFDRSRRLEQMPAILPWPAAGWMSARHFDAKHAWHCTFFGLGGSLPDPGADGVRVFEMDALFVPARTPLPLDYHAVNDDAVIFRPVLEGDLAGRRFWVEIDLPSAKDGTRYLVDFAPASAL
ncbi:MAG TPA: hypothetical protein VFG37_13885 [Planctomycetota bacterium]|nr:hypothetical protein [Planctomycetota bacterium]